jgi:hypothetical protein
MVVLTALEACLNTFRPFQLPHRPYVFTVRVVRSGRLEGGRPSVFGVSEWIPYYTRPNAWLVQGPINDGVGPQVGPRC